MVKNSREKPDNKGQNRFVGEGIVTMDARKLALSLSIAALGFTAAAGMGLYVYPDRPYVVWTLLFLCWACFRLHRRAQALFANRQQQQRQQQQAVSAIEALAPYLENNAPSSPPSSNTPG